MRNSSFLVLIVTVALISGCSSEPEIDSSVTVESIEAAHSADSPIVISHRGGAAVYPEESMEGFRASVDSGFLPEMDIQFIADGTPVLIHDDTADRTLTGVTGPVDEISLEQWNSATIKPPAGGDPAKTVTLEDLLDELGGKTVMVPEIKPGASDAEVDRVLTEFEKRNLKNSLIVQSFDWGTATEIADRGFNSLYLMGKDLQAQSPKEIKEAGIRWVGPSKMMPASVSSELADAGLKVIPYTYESSTAASSLLSEAIGYFTDDPWSE